MGEEANVVVVAALAGMLLTSVITACGSADDKKSSRPDPEYQSGGADSGGAGASITEGGLGGEAGAPVGGQGGVAGGSFAGQAGSTSGAAGEGSLPDDSLRAYYPFSGDALDASGHGNDCTTGSATLQEDRHGAAESAYHFDGTTTSYLSCGNGDSLDVTGTLTLAAWFRPEAASLTGLNRALIAKWFPPDQRSYALLIQNEDQSGLGLCDATHGLSLAVDPIGSGAQPAGTLCDDVAVSVDVWQHAAAVLEPGERLSLYLDGALVKELAGDSVVSGASASTTALHIGRNNLGYYAGAIDEVRIYSRALGAEEIAELASQ